MRCDFGSVILAAVLALLAPAVAHAHNLGVQAKLKDGKVHVEVYYDDNTPAIKANVLVFDAKGKKIAHGTTDADGRWSLDVPEAGQYELRADAGAGHNAKTTFTITDAGLLAVAKTQEVSISDSPTREQFTSTPWLKIAIGVSVIAVLGAAFLLASKFRKVPAP
jgi:hypothetical protein